MWRRLWRNFLARVKRGPYLRYSAISLHMITDNHPPALTLTEVLSSSGRSGAVKKKLIADIRKKGLRYKAVNGNGIEVEKPNESVTNLPKITASMLKILNDLNLKEPLSESTPEDDYL